MCVLLLPKLSHVKFTTSLFVVLLLLVAENWYKFVEEDGHWPTDPSHELQLNEQVQDVCNGDKPIGSSSTWIYSFAFGNWTSVSDTSAGTKDTSSGFDVELLLAWLVTVFGGVMLPAIFHAYLRCFAPGLPPGSEKVCVSSCAHIA